MKQILHLEAYNYPSSALQKLQVLGNLVSVNISSQTELDTLLSEKSFDYIFTTIGYYLGKENLQSQLALKAIITPTTGLNHLDLDYLNYRNIKIISLKGEVDILRSVQSTAEHTWALLLSLIRNISKATLSVKQGSWDRAVLLCDELNTKTLGIIGFGRLGNIISEYAKAFSMKTMITDISEESLNNAIAKGVEVVDLSALLAKSDYILLMASYSKENENLINEESFSIMKQTAYFINTSRGEMVDEEALLKALKTKKIKGAALDVLRDDSSWKLHVPKNHPLIEYASLEDNLLITPHIGGYGKVSIEKTREFITRKFIEKIEK